jgi:hypothetical protein
MTPVPYRLCQVNVGEERLLCAADMGAGVAWVQLDANADPVQVPLSRVLSGSDIRDPWTDAERATCIEKIGAAFEEYGLAAPARLSVWTAALVAGLQGDEEARVRKAIRDAARPPALRWGPRDVRPATLSTP